MSLWKGDEPNNIPSEAFKQYWKRSKYLQFLKIAFGDMKPRFSQENRSYYELCRLIPQNVIEHYENGINELNLCLIMLCLYQRTSMVD